MGEKSVLFQFAVVALLAAVALLLILVVIQNNDTQRKLEELRAELRGRGNSPTAAAPANQPPADPPSLPAGATVTRGPDGVAEYTLAGLRVRLTPYRNPQAVDGDRLVRSFNSDPPGLNPYVQNEALCGALFALCNDTLAVRDFDDLERWVPELATGWSVEQTVRVHLKEPIAEARVQAWLAEPAGAAERRAADIVEILAEGPRTIRLRTDSVRSAFELWLEKRLPAAEIEPAQYVTAILEPKFQPPAGQTAVDFESLYTQLSAQSDRWRIHERRSRGANEHLLLVLGDAAALAAECERLLRAASPQYDPQNPATHRGWVEPVETQRYDVRPTVRFNLRRGVRWHSIADPREATLGETIPGPELTAADFLFTWHSIVRNEKVPCEFIRNYLKDLDAVRAPDAYIVEFDWFRPYFQLFGMSAGFQVLPKHIFESQIDRIEMSKFNRVICGTGAWRFKNWTPNVSIEFERNPDYWRPGPHLTAFQYKLVKDPTVNLSLFQEGKLDAITLTPDQWKQYAGTEACAKIAQTESGVANSYRYVGYNARDPLFKDKMVRRALTMLVDRQTIIDRVFNGMAVPLTGPFHPQTPNFDPTVAALPYDPAAAKKILADAGWRDTDGDGVLDKDGVPFRYTLLFPSGRPEIDQVAAFIQQGNRKAGIETELATLEWSAFLGRINNLEFQACILGWSLSYEADPYQLWHSSQIAKTRSNFCGFVNPRADEIIVQGRYLLDPVARQNLYREFHRLIADEQPYTFLFVPRRMNVFSRRYQDVKYTLLDTDLNRWFVPRDQQK